MKSCTKVVVVFFVLCAINACLAEAKWLWLNEDVIDDLELEADNAQDQHFKNAKRKMSLRKDVKPVIVTTMFVLNDLNLVTS